MSDNATISNVYDEPKTIVKKYYDDIDAKAKKREWVKTQRAEARRRVKENRIQSLEKVCKSSFLNLNHKKKAFAQRKLEKPKVKLASDSLPLLLAVRTDVNYRPESIISRLLKDLKLHKPLQLAILKNSTENIEKLRQLGPFIFYGPLSSSMLRRILSRHASVITPENISELLDTNLKVEQFFGDLEIFSIDELNNFIYEANSSFEEVIARLSPIFLAGCKRFNTVLSESPAGYIKEIDQYIKKYLL